MKLLIKLLAILIFGVIALGVAGYFLVPPAAKTAADEGSQYAFGVPATIAGIGASPGFGTTSVGFEGYALSSPDGFDETLLSIGKFSVGVGTKSIIGDTKDVNDFVLEDVNLTLVQDGMKSNLVPVLKHMREKLGSSDDPKAPAEPKDDSEPSPGPKLRLGEVKVEGVSATLKLRGIPGIEAIDKTFTVPAYVANLSSLTGSDGKTVAEIAGFLLEDLKERALAGAEEYVPPQGLAVLRSTLDGGLEGGLGGALDAAKDAVSDQAQEAYDEARDELNEKVDGEIEKAKNDLNEKANDALDDLIDKGGLKGDAKKAADSAKEEGKKALKGLFGDGK